MSIGATHVRTSLRVNNSGVTRLGFGTIMIPSWRAAAFGAKKSLVFTRLSDVIAAGFPADGPEALAVNRVTEQSPAVKSFKLYKFANAPTVEYAVSISNLGLDAYELAVDGEGVTETTVSYVAKADIDFVDADVNVGTDAISAPGHGELTGAGPYRVKNQGGALPTSTGNKLAADVNLWLIRVDDDHVKFADSKANALAGVPIDLLVAAGGGTNTLLRAANDVVMAQLVDQLNAVEGKNFTAAQVPGAGDTDTLTITGDAPGDFFTVEALDTNVIKIANTTADPGTAADLAQALINDPDFYYVTTTVPSKPIVMATAAWTEATEFKAYTPSVSDSDCENTDEDGGDVISSITALGYKRTLGPIYHRKPSQMIGIGCAGRIAPLTVGKWTVAYKAITGCTYDKLTATQIANLDAKKATYYKLEGDRSILWEGRVGNPDYLFFDVTVGLDRFLDDLQKSMFGVFVGQDKVEYDDEDIEHIRAAGFGAITRGIRDGYVAAGTPGNTTTDKEPVLVFPRVADIDPGARALRNVPSGSCSFRYKGAVHTVDVDIAVNF